MGACCGGQCLAAATLSAACLLRSPVPCLPPSLTAALLAAARTPGPLQVVTSLLEGLMRTNPRAFDARAAIGLKVQDRTVLLDNPVKAQQAQQQQQASAGGRGCGAAARLASRKQQRALGLYQLQGAGLT